MCLDSGKGCDESNNTATRVLHGGTFVFDLDVPETRT